MSASIGRRRRPTLSIQFSGSRSDVGLRRQIIVGLVSDLAHRQTPTHLCPSVQWQEQAFVKLWRTTKTSSLTSSPMDCRQSGRLTTRYEMVPGEAPPHKSPCRLSSLEMEGLRHQVEIQLKQGWAMPSSNPYGAPVLFILKKDAKWHMCINYRALNKMTMKNRYPFPKIEELLERLCGAQYFKKIDLYSGCHQIRL